MNELSFYDNFIEKQTLSRMDRGRETKSPNRILNFIKSRSPSAHSEPGGYRSTLPHNPTRNFGFDDEGGGLSDLGLEGCILAQDMPTPSAPPESMGARPKTVFQTPLRNTSTIPPHLPDPNMQTSQNVMSAQPQSVSFTQTNPSSTNQNDRQAQPNFVTTQDGAIRALVSENSVLKKNIESIYSLLNGLTTEVKSVQRAADLVDICTKNSIAPPQFNENGLDLDSGIKASGTIQKLFAHINVYTGNEKIRELLEGLNNTVEDKGLQLTEKLFKSILLSKISHGIRSTLGTQSAIQNKSVQQLYNSLISLFDKSEDESQALTCLLQLKGNSKIKNFADWLCEALRLLKITGHSISSQSHHFLIAIANILPDSTKDRIDELVRNYRSKRNGTYPDVETTINFLTPYRERIDSLIAEQSSKFKHKIRNVGLDFEDLEVHQVQQGNRPCTYCGKPSHNWDNCFQRQKDEKSKEICSKCGRYGHTVKTCHVRCKLCHSQDHLAPACDVYKNQAVTQSKCEICFSLVSLALFHPEEKCVLKNISKN